MPDALPAASRPLTATELSLMVRTLHAVRQLTSEGRLITPTTLARRSGIRRTNIYRSLGYLQELGFIAPTPRENSRRATWALVQPAGKVAA